MLPIPEFHDAARSASWTFRPDAAALAAAAHEWAGRHAIRPAAGDRFRVELLLIDCQRDFCHPEGSLFVGGRSGNGAVEDVERVTRFVYRHLDRISSITATLDTHVPLQIFSPGFWLDRAGRPLPAHSEIAAADVRSGAARPRPELAAELAPGGDESWLARHALAYCEALEAGGRYRLRLWPPHCLLGGEGHALAGAIEQARLFHAAARRAPGELVLKGRSPLTESYSALAPEVRTAFDGRPLAPVETGLRARLAAADAVLVAGEAASHCVRATLEDLLDGGSAAGRALAAKTWILEDAMSAVAVPDPERPGEWLADFTDEAAAALDRLAAAGMHRWRTEDGWPFPR